MLQGVGDGESAGQCAQLGAALTAAGEPAGQCAQLGAAVAAGGEPVGQCAQLGAAVAAGGEPAALLVLGDGSARRSVAAPGHLDERAVPFDDEVVRAVRDGDLPALAALDPGLARELMVTGRPAWQVLCGALGPGRPVTEVLYADAPFGVAYLVAQVDPGSRVASSAQRKFSPK